MVVPASGFAVPSEQEIQRLAAEIAPGVEVVRLGGWMSVNFQLKPPLAAAIRSTGNDSNDSGGRATGALTHAPATADLVLHVHPRYVTRRRLAAVQRLRQTLAAAGVTVPVPLPHRNATILRCAGSLAELERFLPNDQLQPSWPSYRWLFHAMGSLQRVLAKVDLDLPHPSFTHYAAAGTLRTWASQTHAAVCGIPEATLARQLEDLTKRIRNAWVPPTRLPTQLIHGDVKLENVLRAPDNDGSTIYLDFGHAARRARIHDLAFALTHSVITVDGDIPQDPAAFPWHEVPPLIKEYEAAAGWRLTPTERRALAPYTAAVRLYAAASAWNAPDSAEWVRGQEPALRLAEWLLDHPDLLLPD